MHVHQLLLYAIFGEALIAFLEVFHRGNIILELLRCTLTLLQGSWFWEVNVDRSWSVTRFMLQGMETPDITFSLVTDWFCTVPSPWP